MTPERRNKIDRVLSNRQSDLTIVMENVHDPHNIAAVMRTCDAVGIQEIYILNTRTAAPTKFSKKSSASAAGWLTIHHFDDTAACMNALKAKNYKLFATHLGENAHSLYGLDLTDRVALVFGNEHAGVTDEALSYCDGNFVIPQFGMVQSLNISVACAVSLYEAMRQRHLKGFYDGTIKLTPEQIAQLSEKWALTTDAEE